MQGAGRELRSDYHQSYSPSDLRFLIFPSTPQKMSAAQEEDFVDYEEDEETAQEAKADEKDTKK